MNPKLPGVVFANLSFAYDLHLKQRDTQESFGTRTLCVEARASEWPEGSFGGDKYPDNYYPEYHLSNWFKQKHQRDIPCYAFNLRSAKGLPKLGVASYRESLQALCAK